MVLGMRLLMLVLCLGMLGCFRTIDSAPSGPGVPRPVPTPRPFDAGPFTDLGPWERDSPAFSDAGSPDAVFSDGGVLDGAMPDPSGCPQCEFDSDCPQSAPVGCAQAMCVAGSCIIGAGRCDAMEACDQDELLCTPEFVELQTTLRTDYAPFMEFDRIVMEVDDTVVYQDTQLEGDALEGILLGPVLVGQREELRVQVTLYRGCDELVSRLASVRVGGSPLVQTIVISR